MSSLNQWLWQRSSVALIYNPRLVGQIVGQSPIDGPTEVDIARIPNKTDSGTKRNLYNEKCSMENGSTTALYSLKMKILPGMRHIVFYATSMHMIFDSWNPCRYNFWPRFQSRCLMCCFEHWFRCYCYRICHHRIVQAQRMKLTGHRW